ncbi:MAG: DUF1127 domain-containing protein [Pseudomonadota bacterium]
MNRTVAAIENLTKTDFSGMPLGRALELFRLWHQRHSTRQALNRLDAHGLSDVGLTDADREIECRKWFWQK